MENNALEALLGPISPLNSQARSEMSGTSSLSFTHGTAKPPLAKLAGSQVSSGSYTRPPLGELQGNSFEFKPTPMASSKPPLSRLSGQTQATRMEQEPVTPTSVVADSAPAPAASEPVTPQAPAAQPAAAAAPAVTWGDVLAWKHPIRSAFWFLTGLLMFGLVSYAMYGPHEITLVSGLSYFFLFDLGLNFLRSFVSSRLQEACRWTGSTWTKAAVDRSAALCNGAAALHDRLLSSVDPFITLKVAASLWALAWLGCMFSAWTLALAGYVLAFTLPTLYNANRGALAAMLGGVNSKASSTLTALQMPRTTRLLGVLLALGVLFAVSSWTQFAIGTFVAFTYWRTTLKPKELLDTYWRTFVALTSWHTTLKLKKVEAIREAAAPYTQSVRKATKRLSMAVDDAIVRYSTGPQSRTKSHFR